MGTKISGSVGQVTAEVKATTFPLKSIPSIIIQGLSRETFNIGIVDLSNMNPTSYISCINSNYSIGYEFYTKHVQD